VISQAAIVIIAHDVDDYLIDLLQGLRRFCPAARLAWFDSGVDPGRYRVGVERIPASRPLTYARVTPAFFEIFEWFMDTDASLVINVETDAALIAPGYLPAIERLLAGADYVASRYRTGTSRTSRWRPYRTLKPDLPELLDLLSVDQTDQAFSPGQVFSRRYVETLLSADWYPKLREFVTDNQVRERSFTLQEVLLPTIVRALGLRARAYPAAWERYNRYRPYLAASAIREAVSQGVSLVHPVRRDADDPARRLARSLACPALQERK
jgi:hypothetical protein